MGSKVVTVDLDALTSNKRIYVRLSESLLGWMAKSAKSKKTYSEFSNKFYKMGFGEKISLVSALQIAKKLRISTPTVWENIDLITSAKNTNIGIKKPKIPFNFATRGGVRFIAAIQGDGHFNKFLQCGYSNQNKKMISRVLGSAREVFGDIDFKLYSRKDNTYNLNFPKIMGLIMEKVGLQPGFKCNTNPAVPEFIFGLQKRLKAVYLKQFFSDEGNIRLKDRRVQVKQTISTEKSKEEIKENPKRFAPKVLRGCKRLLNGLGMDSKISLSSFRKTPNGTKADWELSMYRIENLQKFRNLIGFEQIHKNKLLKQAIESYRFPSAPRNGRLEFALNKCKEVQEKHGFIDKEKLAEQCKRSLKTAAYYLIDLKKRGLVKITEKPKRADGRFKKFKYVLTEQ